VESLVCFHMCTPQETLLGRTTEQRTHCSCLLGGLLALQGWHFNFFSVLKTWAQSGQANLPDLSLPWVLWCWLRSDFRWNALPHSPQW